MRKEGGVMRGPFFMEDGHEGHQLWASPADKYLF